jgi:hypothetical protein
LSPGRIDIDHEEVAELDPGRPARWGSERLDDELLDETRILRLREVNCKPSGKVAHDSPDDFANGERHADWQPDLGGNGNTGSG